MQSLVKKSILGVDITDASEEEVLEYVFDVLEHSREKLYIVTPNPEMVMYCRKHKQAQAILNRAGISLCDGMGLYKAAQIVGKPLKSRIPGTDFMEELCKASVKSAVTVGFLGGRQGVAERASDCLKKKYPGLQVAFVGAELSEDGLKDLDILFVAFGFPKQEEWMAEHLEKVPVRVMMGVGGAFDYFSGEVSRAPALLRNAGLEWLYRLIRQPWRLKRQLALPRFAFLVFREKLLR